MGEGQADQLRDGGSVVPADAPVVVEGPDSRRLHYKLALFPPVGGDLGDAPPVHDLRLLRALPLRDAAECLSLGRPRALQPAAARGDGAQLRGGAGEGPHQPRACELVQLVRGTWRSFPGGTGSWVDDGRGGGEERLASFTRSAPGDALGYEDGSSDGGNDDPWRSFDVNRTLTYAWARTAGQAKSPTRLSESEAAVLEWAASRSPTPRSSADGLLVCSSFVDSKDMERPKFAKAAEEHGGEPITHTAAAHAEAAEGVAAAERGRGARRVEGADGRGRVDGQKAWRSCAAQAAALARSGQLGAGRARRRR